jgi:hypothetical protein
MPESQAPPNDVAGHHNGSLWHKTRSINLRMLSVGSVLVGIGIGLSFMAVSSVTKWYARRPVAAKVWPPVSLSAGAAASLKTDWNGDARYQLRISPEAGEIRPTFRRMARLAELGPGISQFRAHFFDRAGFELCSGDLDAVPDQNSSGRAGLVGNGHFACSRADYTQLDRWSLDYRFPSLLAGAVPEKLLRRNL